MPKFFVAAESIRGRIIRMGVNNSAHLKALRLRSGEALTVSDGSGWEYSCLFRGMEAGEGIAEVIDRTACQTEALLRVHLFTALPKGDKAELILQKAVELGASDICFFLSSRCVSRPDENAMRKRLERLSRVSEEAAMQSGRGRIPEVFWIPHFPDMLKKAALSELSLFLWEEAETMSLRRALRAYPDVLNDLSLISGPEGGFSREEAELAERCGIQPITLGKRILRCETAPLCALSAVMFETGNLE